MAKNFVVEIMELDRHCNHQWVVNHFVTELYGNPPKPTLMIVESCPKCASERKVIKKWQLH
jgi:hypothetical protein